MAPLLVAEHLGFAYADTPVLREVEVRLPAGQVVALLGPNGSGKSTLIRLLLGHLRGQGRIAWLGRDLHAWRRRELARRVAYLPQSPSYEPDQRVSEVLRLGRAPYWGPFGLESTHDAQIVQQVAEQLDLADLLDRRMDRLSGGQRQRVFVGRCLVQEPVALLLDEPNTYLDLKHQVELGLLLRRLAAERNMGVLMASHDLNLAAALADRVLLLQSGRLAGQGMPAEVLDPALLSEVYDLPMRRLPLSDGAPLVFPDLPRPAKTP